MNINVFWGVLVPFLGTALGAACVLFMRGKINEQLQRLLTGFAAGVMVAASIWSLILPAVDQSSGMGKLSFIPAAAGFWLGILFLLLLDHIIPHLHQNSNEAEGPKSRLGKTTMLVLAVTLHNIPEGMAVGVVFAGYMAGNEKITVMGAMALSIGIAIQNFPEGAIISMPLRSEGMKKSKAFFKWSSFRSCGTCFGSSYNSGFRFYYSGSAISSKLCGRCNALCSSGRAYSGNVCRRTFQPGNHFLCTWIFSYDDP